MNLVSHGHSSLRKPTFCEEAEQIPLPPINMEPDVLGAPAKPSSF